MMEVGALSQTATMGFFMLLFAQFAAVSNTHGFMAIGGGLIAYAHFYNWQLANRLKDNKEKIGPWLNPSRIILIAFLVLYIIGLRTAFQNNHQPPSREEILKAVWHRVDD